jgi:protein-S-isoprenylcysteine O-methyltransferase Ste14
MCAIIDAPDITLNVKAKALISVFVLTIVIGLLLFVPAGTIHYWQAWVYVGIYFIASLLVTLYLAKHDPALLQRRMSGGPTAEKRKPQRVAMLLATAGFSAAMVVPALDHRFRWSSVPIFAVVVGDILTALWFYVAFLVFRENTFSAATVQVAEGQAVISTGPYAIVRHPMYTGGLFSFIGTSLALGSWWGALALVVVLPALVCALHFHAPISGTDRRHNPAVKKVTMSHTSASSGREMYMSYCAACHGADGKGDGPAASALKEPPPDLTTLAENNGGKYPADHVAAVLRFGVEAPAHGSKEMPTWGDLFAALHGGHTSAQVNLRIANLNDYIKSLQTK